MKQTHILITAVSLLLLNGCLGGSTDPRQGGLFSYNPDAYEERISQKEEELDMIEEETTQEQQKSEALQEELSSQKKKMKKYK